jgi:parallel beta-helix repeat protein
LISLSQEKQASSLQCARKSCIIKAEPKYRRVDHETDGSFFLTVVTALGVLAAGTVSAGAIEAGDPDPASFFDESRIPAAYDETIALAPGQSIQAALARAGQNRLADKSTKIVLSGGVYRESVNFDGGACGGIDLTAPFIALEAAPGADVAVTGAVPVPAEGWVLNFAETQWSAPLTDEMATVLSAQYPEGARPSAWLDWGIAPNLGYFSAGMLYANGEMYVRVLDCKDFLPGTMMLDFKTKKILVKPRGNFDPAAQTPELALYDDAFYVHNLSNFVLRGVSFTGAGYGAGLRAIQLQNALIENCTASRNRGIGLNISSTSYSIVRNVTISENGTHGMTGYYSSHVLFDRVIAEKNTWIGQFYSFTYWDPAGTKFCPGINNCTFVDSRWEGNFNAGIWFDTGAANITMLRCKFLRNQGNGLELEANPGPMLLKDCAFAGNGTGVCLRAADGVTFDGCTIYGNAERAVSAIHEDREGHGNTPKFINCTIASATGQLYWPLYLGDGNHRFFSDFARTYTGGGNRFYHTNPAQAFSLESGGKVVYGTLAQWQALTGQDADSTMNQGAPPALPAVTAAPITMQYLDCISPETDVPVIWTGVKGLGAQVRGNQVIAKGFVKWGNCTLLGRAGDQLVEVPVKVRPTTRQWLLIIFLFGWIWM